MIGICCRRAVGAIGAGGHRGRRGRRSMGIGKGDGAVMSERRHETVFPDSARWRAPTGPERGAGRAPARPRPVPDPGGGPHGDVPVGGGPPRDRVVGRAAVDRRALCLRARWTVGVDPRRGCRVSPTSDRSGGPTTWVPPATGTDPSIRATPGVGAPPAVRTPDRHPDRPSRRRGGQQARRRPDDLDATGDEPSTSRSTARGHRLRRADPDGRHRPARCAVHVGCTGQAVGPAVGVLAVCHHRVVSPMR